MYPYGAIWTDMVPIWAHIGAYGPIWASYGPTWVTYEAHVDPYGAIWTHMGPVGPYGLHMRPIYGRILQRLHVRPM